MAKIPVWINSVGGDCSVRPSRGCNHFLTLFSIKSCETSWATPQTSLPRTGGAAEHVFYFFLLLREWGERSSPSCERLIMYKVRWPHRRLSDDLAKACERHPRNAVMWAETQWVHATKHFKWDRISGCPENLQWKQNQRIISNSISPNHCWIFKSDLCKSEIQENSHKDRGAYSNGRASGEAVLFADYCCSRQQMHAFAVFFPRVRGNTFWLPCYWH